MSERNNPKDSERMIYALAHRVVRRLSSVSQPIMKFDDIVQELWIAWCLADKSFDPSRGIPWAAYLQRGMRNHINRTLDVQLERFSAQTFAKSLDAPTQGSGQDIDGAPLGEMIASTLKIPAELTEERSNYEYALGQISERSRLFVRILHDQPQEVLQEVLISRDKAEHAQKLGAPYVTLNRITTAMVFDLMGATRSERSKIYKEVRELGLRMSA